MSIGTLRDKLTSDLRTAMKARDQSTVSALRTLMAALDNAEAVPVDLTTLPKVPTTTRHEAPRKVLSNDDIHRLLQAEVKDRQRAYGEYLGLGLTEQAQQLQQEIGLITAYLALFVE